MDPEVLLARVKRGLAEGAPDVRREAIAALRPDAAPDDVRAALQDPTRSLGRYVLVKPLGRGGAAEVWSAWDRDLARRVAVKLLLTEAGGLHAARRFQREAAVAGQIRHPNIVAVHDAGEWKERLFLVMDLIEGGDLSRWFGVEPVRIAEIVEKVARAIHEAHERGIIHRDLKPSNVLMDRRGEPLVSDFGLAVWELHPERITVPGGLVGTPPYMAPEQFQGRPDVRTDVYAMGVMLYEMLTGVLPYRSTAIGELIKQVEAGDAPSPARLKPSVPADLDAVCMRAMARDPVDRYASALEMAEDLRRFRAGEPIRAKPASRVTRMVRWTRRRRVPIIAGAALLLVLWFGWRWLARFGAEREIQKAALSYREGRLDETLAAAQRAVDRDPGLAEGHFWIGRVHLRRHLALRKLPAPWRLLVGIEFGDPAPETEAAREHRLAAEKAFSAMSGGEGWEAPCASGMLHLLQGRYAESEKALTAAKAHPSMKPDREIDALYALSLYYQKRFESAATILSAMPLHDEFTSVAHARALHGAALEQEARGEAPIETYQRAMAASAATAPTVRVSRALYLDRRGALEAGAEIDAVLATSDDPLTTALACLLGSQIARHGMNHARRRELLDRALKELEGVRREAGIAAWVEAAVRVNRLDIDRDFDGAERAVSRASKLLGAVPDVLVLEAHVLAIRDPGVGGARAAYDHVATRPESPPELHAQRGHFALMWLTRAEEAGRDCADAESAARASYGEALKRDPSHLGAISGLGNVVLSKGRREAESGRIESSTLAELEEVAARMPSTHAGAHLGAGLAALKARAAEQAGLDPLAYAAQAMKRNAAMLEEGGCDAGALAMAVADAVQREKAWRAAARLPIEPLLARLDEARRTMSKTEGDARVALAGALLDMFRAEMTGGADLAERYRAVIDALDPVVAALPGQVTYAAVRAQVALSLAVLEDLRGADGTAWYERAVADATRVLEARPRMATTRLARMGARVALAEKALAAGKLAGVKAAVDEIGESLAVSPEPWRLKLVRGRIRLLAAVMVRKDREACAEWLKGAAEDVEEALGGPLRPMALEVRAHARLVEARVLGKAGAAEACLGDAAELGEEPVAWALRGQARAVLAKTKEERAAGLEDLKRAFAGGVTRTGMIAEIAEELERGP